MISFQTIKSVKLIHYKYNDIKIELPTHYNKKDIIVNSYKYDIKAHALHFMITKIYGNELSFLVELTDGTFIDSKCLFDYLIEHPDKKIYTKISGLLVKETREYYDEMLKSSIYTIERLLECNQKMGLSFKVLKVFVDEFIVDTPLIINNIPNEYSYNFKKEKFVLFRRQTDFLKKQIYIFSDKIDIKHNFSRKENLINDLNNILEMGMVYDRLNTMTSKIINKQYNHHKLIQIDQDEYIFSDGVKVSIKYLKGIDSVEYDIDYYYKIYQDIASNIVLANSYL